MVGFFVSVEGGEATGKTTLQQGLYRRLEEEGWGDYLPSEEQISRLHEPGGTRLAERLRELLLTKEFEIDEVEAVLMFNAARSSLMRSLIIPLLREGKIVILDRFVDSTLAYQCGKGTLSFDDVERVNQFGARRLYPDLTLLIDLPVEVALARRQMNPWDRYESRDLAYHRKVRENFHRIAQNNPQRIVMLDGQRPVGQMVEEAYLALLPRLRVHFQMDKASRAKGG